MTIDSFAMIDGMWRGVYDLAPITIICNPQNKQGKTTFLRGILYALGYQIPSTLGLHFERMQFSVTITKDNKDKCILTRIGNVVDVLCGGKSKTYSLPSGQYELHRALFGIENELLIDNLLGAYYFDQEKGWTLLNRGKVIGSIHFSIEDFLRGLSDRPCLEEYKNRQAVLREIDKYKQMLSVAEYQASNKKRGEDIPFETPVDAIKQELLRLYTEKRPLDDELSRLQNVIRKNASFKNYIAAMHLCVRNKDGVRIPVNADTLEDWAMNEEFLYAKREELRAQLSVIDNKIFTLQGRLNREFDLIDVETSIQHFDAEISRIQIDKDSVERILKDLGKRKKELDEKLHYSIATGSSAVESLRKSICAYLAEFGIDERHGHDIFTHNIKSLTGAFFHMLVFAFKISYAKLVRDKTGVVLPIIIDSPNGREVEREKVDKMYGVLARDFAEHQLIVATIRDPMIQDQKLIPIANGVMKLLGEVGK